MENPNLGVKYLSEQEIGQIVAYKDSRLSYRDIAAKLNRHHATIGDKRSQKLSPKQLSHVKLLFGRDPFTTIRKLKEEIERSDICDRTL